MRQISRTVHVGSLDGSLYAAAATTETTPTETGRPTTAEESPDTALVGDGSETSQPTPTEELPDTDAPVTGDGPGFGALTAVGALDGVGYRLTRGRADRSDSPDE